MANLTETSTFESGIYQLEKTDPVVAGKDGIANKQAQQLANRTKYLKAEQDKLKTATAAATTAKSGTVILSSSVTDSGETKASTTKATKTAMDRANAAHTLASGKANATHTHKISDVTDFALKTLTTEDLDTVKVAGFYKQDNNANSTSERHYPEAKAGSLVVKQSTFGWQQEYTVWDSNRRYVRNTQSSGLFPTTWRRIDALDSVPTSRTYTAGSGLTGGGNLSTNRTFTLGTPSPITATSTNAVTAESHTHAIDKATTSIAGIVQLSTSTTGTSTTKAATESAAKTAMDRANAAYNLANGKAATVHNHGMNQITGLESVLDAKAPLASPAFSGAPTAPTAAATTNTDQIATTKFVKTLIAQLVGSAPAALDTLQELAAAMGNNANLSANLLNEIGKKATKATTLSGYGIADFVLKKLTTEDLDTVKVAGSYYRDDNAGATAALHYPEVKAGVLEVRKSTYGWLQEYTIWDSNRRYIRNTTSTGSFASWKRIDALDSVPTSRTLTAGNGLTGGGNLSTNRTFTLGTPSPITATSTNAVTAESHTHAIDKASTTAAGIVQLSDITNGTSTTKAATENAVKKAYEKGAESLGLLTRLFPVGHLLLTVNAANPSTYGYPGTWTLLAGDVALYSANSGQATKNITGSNTPAVPIPQHSHTATIANTDLGTKHTNSTGAHTHTGDQWAGNSGHSGGQGTYGTYNNGWKLPIYINSAGAHTHSVAVGAHSHSVTINNTGTSGATINVMGRHIKVYMWFRTA
ncbi:Phage tail fibre repeat-containing protein [Pasteurella testudinis DSM 23072]|uniref:Phage tail fibre repeat-containing protein n=1 Tax=Pasteurella testudinis DSM 23072 TaxID=1122938 RepID=A0A1W1UMR9_9PAST|nr:tail fiber protein [Pasteurella testudinis]SMB82392.1 Phage tail fibre repeat-containing protein [Pasteurella testudinis DSM 23072]SUB52221.1 Phage tail fibre repeat [Pasteurella testudinis]